MRAGQFVAGVLIGVLLARCVAGPAVAAGRDAALGPALEAGAALHQAVAGLELSPALHADPCAFGLVFIIAMVLLTLAE